MLLKTYSMCIHQTHDLFKITQYADFKAKHEKCQTKNFFFSKNNQVQNPSKNAFPEI